MQQNITHPASIDSFHSIPDKTDHAKTLSKSLLIESSSSKKPSTIRLADAVELTKFASAALRIWAMGIWKRRGWMRPFGAYIMEMI
mmetsp:Transcript_32743/g.79266  ORF Transcript_32743/g.79266 Transcript_32743/m.79266 type:complete len:86 (+) Transcript_32743:1514-1771(+)